MRARRWPWLALLLLSVVLHLWVLGDRSLHHDESIHAKLSFELGRAGAYRYDPTYHGPLLYYLTALVLLIRDTDFAARLPIALAGIAMLWVAWRLRRPFGERAAWWVGLLFTVSPLFLFYGRFLRMDLLEVLTASGALLAWWKVLRRGRERDWIALGAWTGLAFATKENAYVTVALLGVTGMLIVVGRGLDVVVERAVERLEGWRKALLVVALSPLVLTVVVAAASARGVRDLFAPVMEWLRSRWLWVAASLAAFIVVTVPLYTVGFNVPEDWMFPYNAISYWWKQHEQQRVGGPWWFHLPRLAQYEFLILAAATVWILRRGRGLRWIERGVLLVGAPALVVGLSLASRGDWLGCAELWLRLRLAVLLGAPVVWLLRRGRRLRPVEHFLFLFGCSSIVMYCYLGEKVPWLGVHQVWPFVPLAGAQLARTMSHRGRFWSRLLAGVGVAATVFVAIVASFVLDEISPSHRRVESLHFVQTCPELRAIAEEGLALEASDGKSVAAVSGEAAWPLTWYWRHLPVWWSTSGLEAGPSLVICDPGEDVEVQRRLGPGYSREVVPLRAWWLMYQWDPDTISWRRWLGEGMAGDQWARTDVAAVLRYAGTRVPWSRIGSTDVVVLRKRGDLEVIPREAEMPVTLRHELGASTARVVGEGWLREVRGVALSRGRLAAADPVLSRVALFDLGAESEAPEFVADLEQPEAVSFLDPETLIIADTWNHRVVVVDLTSGARWHLASPDGGWYGPRAVAVGANGAIAVADTGHRRMVVFDSEQVLSHALGGDESSGALAEPGGLAWLDPERLLVCDTGNRRMLVLGMDGHVAAEVAMADAWSDYYSRPQVVALGPSTWMVSDTPGRALWLIRDGRPRRLGLAEEGLTPTGLAWDADTSALAVGDLDGRVWLLEVENG